jgi:hypothetical protein
MAHYFLTSKFFLWNRTSAISVITTRKTGIRIDEIVKAITTNNVIMVIVTAIMIIINRVIMEEAIAAIAVIINHRITKITIAIIIADQIQVWDHRDMGAQTLEIIEVIPITEDKEITEAGMEEVTEMHQAVMEVIRTDGLMKVTAEVTTAEEIMVTNPTGIGTGETIGTEVTIGTEAMIGTGIVKATRETRTVVGGIKQKMKFHHGLETTMQNVAGTGMK